MSSQEIASWVFGSILLVFVLLVFIIDRYIRRGDPIEPYQHNLLGFVCALLAGLFAFFFTGSISVSIVGSSGHFGKLATQASGGAGAFLIVLWWWKSSLTPVKSKRKLIKITEHIVPARDKDDEANVARSERQK